MQDASAVPPRNPATETPCDPTGLIERLLADGECPRQVAALTIGVDAAAIPAGFTSRLEVRPQLSWSEVIDDRAPRASCGPGYRLISLPEAVPEHAYDLAWVQALEHDVHPLSLLEQLARRLRPRGALILTFAADRHPPRMPRWREFVLAMARRLGFVVEVQAQDQSLAQLRLVHQPRWRISLAQEDDHADIAALFSQVFGHELTPELWNWKYGEGRGNAVIARRDGQLIAHYGGMVRQIRNQGEPDWALQIGDVMVHPQERGVLTRQGPFLLVAATSAELHGPLGFGFPTERAMQVAERMGLYGRAGQLAQLAWAPAHPRPRWRTTVRHLQLDSPEEHRRSVDELWGRMAADLRASVVGERGWRYVSHRYLAHPANEYDVVLVRERFARKALGVVALRRHADVCELLDLIGPLRHFPVLIDQARRLCARWGLPRLYGWITRNHIAAWAFHGAVEEPLDIQIPTSSWTQDERADRLRDRWWLTAGDTDFR